MNIKTPVIRFNNAEEMITIRETLRALGYKIFDSFEKDTETQDFDAVKIDAVANNIVARCRFKTSSDYFQQSGNRVHFETLQDYLQDRFVGQMAREQELTELRAKEQELAVQLADVQFQISRIQN